MECRVATPILHPAIHTDLLKITMHTGHFSNSKITNHPKVATMQDICPRQARTIMLTSHPNLHNNNRIRHMDHIGKTITRICPLNSKIMHTFLPTTRTCPHNKDKAITTTLTFHHQLSNHLLLRMVIFLPSTVLHPHTDSHPQINLNICLPHQNNNPSTCPHLRN